MHFLKLLAIFSIISLNLIQSDSKAVFEKPATNLKKAFTEFPAPKSSSSSKSKHKEPSIQDTMTMDELQSQLEDAKKKAMQHLTKLSQNVKYSIKSHFGSSHNTETDRGEQIASSLSQQIDQDQANEWAKLSKMNEDMQHQSSDKATLDCLKKANGVYLTTQANIKTDANNCLRAKLLQGGEIMRDSSLKANDLYQTVMDLLKEYERCKKDPKVGSALACFNDIITRTKTALDILPKDIGAIFIAASELLRGLNADMSNCILDFNHDMKKASAKYLADIDRCILNSSQ